MKLLTKQNIVFFCIIAFVFAVSVVSWFIIRNIKIENPVVEIYKNGELTHKIELTSDKLDFTIIDDNSNVIFVGHKVGVIHADCPDKICVNTGFIDSGVFPIICLPNRLEIRITDGENELRLDAVAR
ncbi:MAG: NusG domain II-containing protein [Oscillospiraceae bacterium]|nr:NusG domain II-containing protein [Oscillospiraceae bacterium]